MPRKFIKKYLPNAERLRENGCLGFLGEHIYDPELWHLNRRSVSGAVAVGLFMCWVPFPFQMVIAGILAIVFRVNMPISVALVWTTNPVTIPPMFYAAYKLGTKIIGTTPIPYHMEFNIESIVHKLSEIWPSLVVGCLLFAVVSSLLGFLSVRLIWRLAMIRKWQARNERRRLKRTTP
ncbi:MAG: DUF2062 domain-containing protein [Gammaproteobacteria bacterium]|nr:DUF2062 domain-containing protein [Gammaproteobacteria bacterium]